MYEPRGITGVIVSLIIILILAALVLGGCGIITNGMAGMVDSVTDSGASVLNTWTRESNQTTRTRIEWDARVDIKELDVEIAKVNADATKKTSFAFVAFWIVRLAGWLMIVGAAVLFGLGIWQRVQEGGRDA